MKMNGEPKRRTGTANRMMNQNDEMGKPNRNGEPRPGPCGFALSSSSFWFVVLVRRSGSPFWFAVLVRPSGSPFWFALLVRRSGSPFWFVVSVRRRSPQPAIIMKHRFDWPSHDRTTPLPLQHSHKGRHNSIVRRR